MSAPDTPLHGPRPGLTLSLLLAAAVLMLAGGVVLARREAERRIPADRELLRECASTIQAELSRLDAVYLEHLRRITSQLNSGLLDEVPAAAARVEGIALIAVLNRDGTRELTRKITTIAAPPEPELVAAGKRPASPFAFAVPREPVFGISETEGPPDNYEGWLGRPGENWQAWWQRLDSQLVAVIVLRPSEIRTAIERHLSARIPAVWAPVRAAGGLDRLEGHGGKSLAGTVERGDGPPDFVLPLASRAGDWQIVSRDRRETITAWHQPTLMLSGILSTGVGLLGWIVAGAQRRALREVTARVSFVNRVSHELATPLTNLRLSMDLARDSLPPDAAESDRRLAVAQEETARLGRLVENVLTFARGERGRLELHPLPCRPAEILRGVLEQFAPALTRRGITVETALTDSLTAVLDADAFAQIASNLISNVEKYAASGAWMRVELEAAGSALTLRVHDHGPGIPAADAARIFLPFERLDSRITEGVTGTGLGLAIARELATRMGGTVELTTRPEGGCTFTLSVPQPALLATISPDMNSATPAPA